MIIILSLDGAPPERFESYNDLFECITAMENSKRTAQPSNLDHRDWCFTVYPPNEVAALHTDCPGPSPDIQEAFEDNLPLIEICAGDHQHPLYIALTPNVDMDFLKKNWCIDWCTFHYILVREM